MPLKDAIQSIGDALAGVDRTGQYLKGQELGASVNEKRAQTESAMAEARHRRIQAEIDEAKKLRDEQIDAMTTAQLSDPTTAPIGRIIAAGHGADYSGATEGLLHAQELKSRQRVALPAPVGDVAAEAEREAAEEALAPGSAIAARSPRSSGTPVTVADPDNPHETVLIPPRGGSPITVTTPSGPRTARPAAKPLATRPTTKTQYTDELIARGIDENTAIRIANPTSKDARTAYVQVQTDLMRTGNYDEAEARAMARRIVETSYGKGSIEKASQPLVTPKPGTKTDRPPLDSFFQ